MTDPAEDLVERLVTAYNAGDAAAADALFEPDAVVVAAPGRPTTGAERRRVNTEFIQAGLTFSIKVRRVYYCGELALLLTDHSAAGTGPDGKALSMSGTATDIIRRGPDGHWRYVIDNPWGTTD